MDYVLLAGEKELLDCIGKDEFFSSLLDYVDFKSMWALTMSVNVLRNDVLLDKSKYLLGLFYLQLHVAVNNIVENSDGTDNADIVKALYTYIPHDLEYMKDNLNISTLQDIEEMNNILNQTSYQIKSAIEENNLNHIIESHYTLCNKLEEKNLIKKIMKGED